MNRFVQRIVLIAMIACVFTESKRTFRRKARDAHKDQDPYVTVQTTHGPVRGNRQVIDGVTLGTFHGIPYAKPPTGELRFTRPQKGDRWTGVLETLQPRARCLHRPISADPILEGVPETEDCLFLDIYAPLSHSNETLSTMTFIHGGGFYGGSGALYNFTNLALKKVIVVSVSYRLDVFGFLSTEDEVIPGNFGLMDAIFALQWIKDNVQAFGGTPNDITVFGGSAGSALVSAMMLSPIARDLFHKAIMQSGVVLCPWAINRESSDILKPKVLARELGSYLNCQTGNDSNVLLHCLRQADSEALLNASIFMQTEVYASTASGMIWLLVVEDTFNSLPHQPIRLLEERAGKNPIPTIYGFTAQDGSWLVTAGWNFLGVSLPVFKTTVRSLVEFCYGPETADDMFLAIMKAYLPSEEEHIKTPFELRDILVNVATDITMVAFIVQEARMFSRSPGGQGDTQSFIYEFDYRPSYDSYLPEWYGVGHAAEKGFVQGLPLGPVGYAYTSTTETDHRVAEKVMTLWTNFAKYSNPTPQPIDGVIWPQFSGPEHLERLLRIGENLTVGDLKRKDGIRAMIQQFVTDNAMPILQNPSTLTRVLAIVVVLLFTNILT